MLKNSELQHYVTVCEQGSDCDVFYLIQGIHAFASTLETVETQLEEIREENHRLRNETINSKCSSDRKEEIVKALERQLDNTEKSHIENLESIQLLVKLVTSRARNYHSNEIAELCCLIEDHVGNILYMVRGSDIPF